MKKLRNHILTAMVGVLLVTPAVAATTPGTVTLTGTISDYTGSTGSSHYSVAWVTNASGAFIKTLWRQGPDFTSKEYGDHMPTYNNARAGNTVIDGFTGPTSTSYSVPVNNPITTTWDCRDVSGNIVPDGDYYFYIQYTESQTVAGVIIEGPITNGLKWTKEPTASTINPSPQGTQGAPVNTNNFTNLSIVWTPATVAPTITSPVPLAAASMGDLYTHTFTATGSPKLRFVVSSGNLPTGTTLTAGGLLSGTLTTAGTFSGTVSAENGLTPSTQAFSINVAQAIVFTNSVPTNGNRKKEFYHQSTVIGTAPVTFSLDSGTLPPGVTLAANGLISGTPTTLGTFTGKIKAQNGGLAPAALQDFSITISPASTGFVHLMATVNDYKGTTSTTAPADHYSVVWVTDAAGRFIKTLWKQGPGFTSKEWKDHLPTYNTARAGSTVVDGFTSATAFDYASPNNPVMVTWDGLDADGNLVDDGDYKFWIQYSENERNVPGPVTTGGLTWTKGANATSVYPANMGTQGLLGEVNNFTGMSIVWTPAPEIAVHDGAHAQLMDGNTADLGTVEIDTMGTAQTFTIKNVGSADLNIPGLSIYGIEATDFVISPPTSNKLAPDASATFTVAFKPSVLGTRSATLQIANNDADESPFEIVLTGVGAPPPAPEIEVMQPAGSSLTSGAAKRSFGTVKIGKTSAAKTFTVKNTGTATLSDLIVLQNGKRSNDFFVTPLTKKPLQPGETATFKVTFKPRVKGIRNANIQIQSNDADENPFTFKLIGNAVR